MHKLIQGIVDFRERMLATYAARFRELASGQEPDTLFVTCADSRVVPNLLASSHPGDLFIVRNVGNLVPPATVAGDSTGDLSEASAIEYAALVLKVRNIVICGHSGCGAMQSALSREHVPGAPNLAKWLQHADAAVDRLRQEGPLNPALSPYDQLSQLNVLLQLEHLMSYPIVRAGLGSGQLTLSGWWFDIATGDMLAYEPDTRSFEIIDRREANRLLARLGARQASEPSENHQS